MKIPEPRRLPSGKWNVQVTLNGVRKSITRSTRDECLREAMLLKANEKKKKETPAERLTIGEIFDNYVESRRSVCSPTTLRALDGIRRNRFQKLMGVRFSAVSDWQKAVAGDLKDVSPGSARTYWHTLKTAIRHAGLTVPEVKLQQVQTEPKPYLPAEQIPRFLEVIRGDPYELSILLGLHGLRVGEICALRWQDIDLKKRLIRVEGTLYFSDGWNRKETTKTSGSRRQVPFLLTRMDEILSSLDKKQPLPVGNPNKLYYHIKTICRKNDLPFIGCHGLRRSFASWAYSAKVPERIAMEIGGWTSINTMHKHYVQVSSQDVLQYSDAMSSFLEEKKAGSE